MRKIGLWWAFKYHDFRCKEAFDEYLNIMTLLAFDEYLNIMTLYAKSEWQLLILY